MPITYSAKCLKPKFIPEGKRPRGSKAAGLKFERDVKKALPKAVHGQWFEYYDETGPGWCQPDFMLEGTKRNIIIEVKLGDYFEAVRKLLNLYIPVVELACPNKSARGIVILRHVTRVPEGVQIYDSLEAAILASEGQKLPPLVHWLGKGPL